jgi:hypothetical protein
MQKACLLISLLFLLIKHPFLPFYLYEEFKVNTLDFYQLFLFYHKRCKPVSQHMQLLRCGTRALGEPWPAPTLGHAFLHLCKLSLWTPLSKETMKLRMASGELSIRRGVTDLWDVDSPILLFTWWIINFDSFSSKSSSHYLWIEIEARGLAFREHIHVHNRKS